MPDHATSESESPAMASTLTLAGCIATGLSVALVGTALIAAVESTLAYVVTVKRLQNESWPITMLVAAFGRAAVSHGILWLPTMTVAAAGYWLVARRKHGASPHAFITAFFIAVASIVVIPADLELAHFQSRAIKAAACFGGIGVAAASYWIVRAIRSKLGPQRFGRLMKFAAAICAAVTIIAGIAFTRSPFFNHDTYRAGTASTAPTSFQRPHVLWITLDTARVDHLSCYGYAKQTTPFLQEWAAKSIIFDWAIADGVWTVPSHASMFTGHSVRGHGADHPDLWLDDQFTTVAEILSKSGYQTAAFSNNPWVSHLMNLTQGFETSRVIYDLRHQTAFSLQHLCESLGLTPPVPWLDFDFGAAMTNHLVADWLDSQSGQAPLFLFVNYMEPHLPYRVPKRYRRMFLNEDEVNRSYVLRQNAYGDIVHALDFRFNIEGPEFLPQTDRDILKRQYDAALRYLDDRLRELIDLFESTVGGLENTLVIIASDHGEHLDTHGMWSHRFLAYNDLAHVALLIREPGRSGQTRIATPVQLSDLFATVLRATHHSYETAPQRDSRDLIDLAKRGGEPRIAISEFSGPAPGTVVDVYNSKNPLAKHRARSQITAQDGRFKYLVSTDGQRELYSLPGDPGELRNVITVLPQHARRLADFIDQWRRSAPRYVPTQINKKYHLSPAVLRDLRSLGYLNPEGE